MRTAARVTVPLVVGVILAGGAAFARATREPAALPPLAVETLNPPAEIDLPAQIVASGDSRTTFSLGAPVEGEQHGDLLTVQLAPLPDWSSFGVVQPPQTDGLGSLEDFTDWQRRHPEDSQLVGDPVVEHSALGVAVRKDLSMNAKLTITQWAVEHDDGLYLVEWTHRPDDETWRPTVEAMIASWRWG
ncbi:hypothetical protein [Cellulomonas sp. URHE0023]|uniref:hypothetical protein n=1 Tax=Cellulomonas sp. URHE0023 TaxID=1380354 RepID=UPI000AB1128A|nr:hypothetical protein [Cellulomonas sp. URHE0023]